MSIRVAFALALLAGALLASAASAETIILRNGHKIDQCWILEETKASVVIAVIRGDTVGRIVLDPIEILEIDRTRPETIESALARARAAMEAERSRRAAEEQARRAAAATRTAQPTSPTSGSAETGAEGDGGIKTRKAADLVGPTTPEEEAKIEELIRQIGDTRNQGGAAGRREKALKELVQIGPKTIDALTKALSDEVSYRRLYATRALADIAAQDKRIVLYEEAIPKLIALLNDSTKWIRIAANRTLEAISGQTMGYTDPTADEQSQEELATVDKWGKWWEATKPLLPVQ